MANAFCGCLSTLLRSSNGYKHTQKQTLRTNPTADCGDGTRNHILGTPGTLVRWGRGTLLPQAGLEGEASYSTRKRSSTPLPHHFRGFWVSGPGARGWELPAESEFSWWSRVGQVRFGSIPQLWFLKNCSVFLTKVSGCKVSCWRVGKDRSCIYSRETNVSGGERYTLVLNLWEIRDCKSRNNTSVP